MRRNEFGEPHAEEWFTFRTGDNEQPGAVRTIAGVRPTFGGRGLMACGWVRGAGGVVWLRLNVSTPSGVRLKGLGETSRDDRENEHHRFIASSQPASASARTTTTMKRTTCRALTGSRVERRDCAISRGSCWMLVAGRTAVGNDPFRAHLD